MNSIHLHLIVNHAPIFLTMLSVIVLVWGFISSKSSYFTLVKAGFVAAAVFSIIAVQTGERAEDLAHDLSWASDDLMHEHEEIAEKANYVAIVLGIIALSGFFIPRFKTSLKKPFLGILLILGLISTGMFIYTAYLGGHIRHSEVRPDSEISHIVDKDEWQQINSLQLQEHG